VLCEVVSSLVPGNLMYLVYRTSQPQRKRIATKEDQSYEYE